MKPKRTLKTATIAQIMSNKKNRTQKLVYQVFFMKQAKKKSARQTTATRKRLKRFCAIQQQLLALYKLLLLLLALFLVSIALFSCGMAWLRFRVVAIFLPLLLVRMTIFAFFLLLN
jgi:hypothetical protein